MKAYNREGAEEVWNRRKDSCSQLPQRLLTTEHKRMLETHLETPPAKKLPERKAELEQRYPNAEVEVGGIMSPYKTWARADLKAAKPGPMGLSNHSNRAATR